MKICIVKGCNNKHKSFGYCDKHYVHIKKYGTLDNHTPIEFSKLVCIKCAEDWSVGVTYFTSEMFKNLYEDYERKGKKMFILCTTCQKRARIRELRSA